MDFLNINDPINGFIFIPKKFLKIIDTLEIQRLRRIKQLSGAPYVYPGANHTRFEHSIGVMANVQKMLETLITGRNVEIDIELRNSAIIAGLCHDLGHGPFSHNFEDILLKLNLDHEDFTKRIINESEIGERIEDIGLDRNTVANLAVGRLNKNGFHFLDQMIAGSIDCDQMDYLSRDSYHCGTSFNGVDAQRIVILADVTPNNDLGFNIKGVATLESMLLRRLNAFRTIYFHKTSRAIQIMLGEAMAKFNEETDLFKFKNIEDYLKWDDITLYYELQRHEKSGKILERINRRDLIKCCYDQPGHVSEEKPKISNSEKIRNEISEKAKIEPELIYIDYPTMTNVPYQHSASLKQNEIPVFSINQQKEKVMEQFENYSLFLNHLKGHYNIVRVYTEKKYKQEVQEAAEKVLKGVTLDSWMIG